MELENELPWKKPCYECKRIIEDVRKLYIQRYANKLLSPEAEKRIKGMFLEEKRTWYEDLKQSLSREFFPSTIFLFGGGSLLPEIQEVLKENGIRVKFIYPKDLKDIDPVRGYKDRVRAQDKRTSNGVEDTIKNLKSPQYIPSLLIFKHA